VEKRSGKTGLSEGEYTSLLNAALETMPDSEARAALLAMLDLQFAVLLEQFSVQERFVGHNEFDGAPVACGERAMAYLQINSNCRWQFTRSRLSARTALLNTPAGHLIDRLLGTPPDRSADIQTHKHLT